MSRSSSHSLGGANLDHRILEWLMLDAHKCRFYCNCEKQALNVSELLPVISPR